MTRAEHIVALPLFPLRSVLFPGGLLSLKVFEVRYVDLVADCLRRDQPFGVVCLLQGGEVGAGKGAVRFESAGVLARLVEVDSEHPGVLRARCIGTRRFRLDGTAAQQGDGLWVGSATLLPHDEVLAPPSAMQPTVLALANAISTLKDQGAEVFDEPHRLDDAGWVANRWCEILPIALAAKQKLMALESASLRLKIVDEYLRSKQVVSG